MSGHYKGIAAYAMMAVLAFGLITCKKETIPLPQVKIFEGAITIDYTMVNVSAEVTDQGGAEVDSRGFVYGKSSAVQDTIYCGSGTGVFSAEITGLEPGVTYTYEAFAHNAGGTGLSGKVTFSTKSVILPTVSTLKIDSISIHTAVFSGKVTDEGGGTVIKRGVCWSKTSNPTVENSHSESGEGLGEYQCNINELDENTVYYVRAFATNSKGTGYGDEIYFTTQEYDLPQLTTTNVTDITSTSAKGGGYVIDGGGDDVIERGVCWSNNHNPTIEDNHATGGAGLGDFSCDLMDLLPHKKYYVRAYAKNSKGVSYGNEVKFTTSTIPPTVTTSNVTNIAPTSAKGGGNVTDDGGATVTERGVCWSTSHNPTISGTHASSGTGTGNYTVNMTGLTENTTYYVRAYATNGVGTNYGDEIQFKTVAILKPTVATSNVTNIAPTSAKGGGNVTDDGGAAVTERGVCWSTSHDPTVSGSHVASGVGTGSFTVNMTGLTENTSYYVRAYATNSKGTAYGEEIQFKTVAILKPTVTTSSVTEITNTSAKGGGNVTDDGGATVTERGVCWSTSHNPTVSGSHVASGVSTGSFTVDLTGLMENTTYYVRAYATNSKGTAYGEEMQFKTLVILKPTVTTSSVTEITNISANGGGNVTDDGGATVTERGICWSTSHNPTISGNHSSNGTGLGEFMVNMTNLTPNTTYHVRAYAKNSVGVAYGEEVVFTTNAIGKPIVTTKNVTSISNNSATCGGNVTSDGGATVTERGVCWSTSQNPTVNDSHTNNGSGTGGFTSSITGLNYNTTYYVRAYATNSVGTSYGEQKTFTTNNVNMPTVTTNSVTNVTQNTAVCGGNVTNSGGGTVTARGVCWALTPSPTIYNNHTNDGSGTGSFTSNLTGLLANMTYYVRAYATNSAGTSYGQQQSFTTSGGTTPGVPTVTTSTPTDVSSTMAGCGGNVTSDGGASVTQRGVCYSTSQNPTTSNQTVSGGSGTGSFEVKLTGLTPNTTYYVRAYAKNSVGTGYGETKTFTTIATKYAYASKYSPISGYIKYPINNPNSTTTLSSNLYLLGGDYYNGYLYAYGYTDPDDKYYFYKINATTGSIVSSHYVGTDVYCSDCAYDYTTNRLYGSKGDELYIINLSTGAQTYVGSFGIGDYSMVALFCNASGQLYGVCTGVTTHGKFYRINKSTGAATLVATLNYYVNYAQSGGFDRDTGTLYWAGYVSNTRSSGVESSSGLATSNPRYDWYGIIATINPNTGSVTVLQTNTGEQCAWSLR